MTSSEPLLDLETVIRWARSGRESDKVYRFLFLHPDDFFTIPINRTYSIAHQIVYNGDFFLLKRSLVLFADEQIDIRTLSKDNKTLLDVATDQQTKHPEMYSYVQRLFLRDDLIRAAKAKNWNLLKEILNQNPELANEKPPYSTFFLLHYLVQDGDVNRLKDFFETFQFDTNTLNVDLETPLDIARRLKRNDLISILQPTTKERHESDLFKPRLSSSTSIKTTNQLPYPSEDNFPRVDLSNNTLIITNNGDYGIQKKTFPSVTNIVLPTSESQILYPNLESLIKSQKTDSPDPELNDSTPVPQTPITASSNTQLLKNLTCPLLGVIMTDPVIASDGQTYERAAITEYVRLYKSSPTTGASMDANFQQNTELKQIIESMRKQN